MSRMIYVDTLRMVSPGNPLEPDQYDFFLLGSFDAMKIVSEYKEKEPILSKKPITSFETFQKISRSRNIEVPVRYDKQPMCLYTDKDESIQIFDDEKYASMPLVMTLVQLHDEKLDKNTPAALISAFENKIDDLKDEALKNNEADFSEIDYKVFYSLGEADVVLVFRNKSVGSIARLLFRLRTWDEMRDNHTSTGIRILSICSHCAFPKGNGSDFEGKFNTWMEEEKSQEFVTLVNTSYGAQNNKINDEFRFNRYLLGEYDFLDWWPTGDKNAQNARTRRYCGEIIEPMKNPLTNTPLFFRTAFTMPVVQLQESDLNYAESDQVLQKLQPDPAYEKILDFYEDKKGNPSVFKRLADVVRQKDDVKAILGSEKNAEYFAEKLEALGSTLVALLKHLIRLKEGRFEGDLYAYVAPVFQTLPQIAESYVELLNKLINLYPNETDEEKEDLSVRICALLGEYNKDTSELISLLQHLFSVLSVSPHTYLETYGSSMRSIAATCKLLCAYQGITYCISKDFGMELKDPNNEDQGVLINETMLIVPYRSVQQSTKPFFEHSAPTNRIVSVDFDFSEMMNVRKTLYLLLHEVGHHIMTPEFRTARKEPLVKAVFGDLLQHGLMEMYDAPYSCLDYMVLSDEERLWNVKRVNTSGLITKEADVREVIKGYCKEVTEDMYGILDKSWKDFQKIRAPKEEPFALENMFSGMIEDQLRDFIRDGIKNAFESEEFISIREDDEYFANWINRLLVDGVYRHFKDVVDEYVEKMQGQDIPDGWRLGELCTYYEEVEKYKKNRDVTNRAEKVKTYRDKLKEYYEELTQDGHIEKPKKPDPIMPAFVERAIRNALRDIETDYESAIKEIFNAASETYSDIFAFYMLRLDELKKAKKTVLAKNYLRLFKEEGGFLDNMNCKATHRLMRLRTLLEKCYGLNKDAANKEILSVLFNDSPSKKLAEENLQYIDQSVYWDYFGQYADLCIDSIQKRRSDKPKLDKKTKKLKEMYMSAKKDRICRVIKNVHYFWKVSTTR